MDRESCEDGEEPCDVCEAREEESRRQVLRERVIRRLDEEERGDGSRGEPCQVAICAAEESEFYSQEQQR